MTHDHVVGYKDHAGKGKSLVFIGSCLVVLSVNRMEAFFK
uniref:Uncharacterized protein n=1 Tax=Setaria italica TaxID=4555 RepID=K3Y4H7_SETIT